MAYFRTHKITKIYHHSENSRGKGYKYGIEEKDGDIYTGTEKEALERFNNDMFKKYNRADPSPDIDYIEKKLLLIL